MSYLSWLVVALIGGILGKLLYPGDDGNGLFKTIVLGILGGWLGGWLAGFAGFSMTGINPSTIGIAALGSVVVLSIRRWMQKK